MREIKFRAISISNDFSNGNWVYGTFYEDKDGYYMVEEITGSTIKINPDTIRQYTGLKDKNGNEIYEGDIVIDDWYPTEPHPIELPLGGKYKIIYFAPEWCCEKINDSSTGMVEINDFSSMKVIGNIYENPELLK